MEPKLVAAAFGMPPEATVIYLADYIDPTRLQSSAFSRDQQCDMLSPGGIESFGA